ncbi:MAG: MBOAT family O-acyltransferase [Gammaproteobacteria bacterium]|nr:MBOAT family O-acyltransferase [Gammaproteobacteria bacterium]
MSSIAGTYFFQLFGTTLVLFFSLCLPIKATLKRLLFVIGCFQLLYLIAPRLLLFYLIFWSVVLVLQWCVADQSEGKFSGQTICAALLLILAPMVYWKLDYDEVSILFNILGNDAIGWISAGLGEIDTNAAAIIPIGLSFATFRAIDLLVKTWLGKFERIAPERFLFYAFFAPVQVIGPIIEYEEVQAQSEKMGLPSSNQVLEGFFRIAMGATKITCAAVLLAPVSTIFQSYSAEPFWIVWLYLFFYTWYFYLNFSAFSDMAIGVSRLLGFDLKENFNFPYFQENIAEFWNNWHMSLSRFAQRNVYVPMGGYRIERRSLATVATMMVIALWHDLSIGMVLFGFYHGIALLVHRAYGERFKQKNSRAPVPACFRVAGTYVFVALSLPLLLLPLPQATSFYLALLGV